MFNAKGIELTKKDSPQYILKAELNARKIIVCVWWDNYVIIHFEFLNSSQTFNADLYSQQLQHVHENLQRKCFALVKLCASI